MFKFILQKFRNKPCLPPQERTADPVRYAAEKNMLAALEWKKRLALARDPATHQEILFYLATQDPYPDVRTAAGKNWSTPLQASPVIARDSQDDVKLALAGRLVALLPELNEEQN